LLTYRVIDLPKSATKWIHATLHSAAIIFVILGLVCVFVGNNYPDYNGGSYYSNLHSLHSFLGMAAVVLFAQNYLLGLWHFLTPLSVVPVVYRKTYMPYHVFIGFFSLIAATMAVETGIMELITEYGKCDYDISSADINPAKNYADLPLACKLANGAGLCVFVAVLLCSFAMFDFTRFEDPVASNNRDQREALLKNGF
jgi:hypothetical protein